MDGITTAAPRTERVRRILLTACLVLSPALITAGSLIALARGIDFEDRAAVVETAAADPVLWQLQTFVGMFGFLLLVPAVLAIAELIRRRHPALALIGVVLAAGSAIVITGALLFEWTLAAAAGLDVAAIGEFDAAIEDLSGLVVLLPLFFAGPVGLVLLAVGLWRGRAAPRWAAALVVVGMVAVFAPGPDVIAIAGDGAMLAAFLGIAWSYGIRPRPEVITLPETTAPPSREREEEPSTEWDEAPPSHPVPPATTSGG